MLVSDGELSAKTTTRGQRVFISNAFLSKKSKLSANDQLDVHYDDKTGVISMIKSRGDLFSGESTISVTTSGKRLVVDLHSKRVAQVLGKEVDRVQLRYSVDRIDIHPTFAARRKKVRVDAAKNRLATGMPMQVGEICHGVGGLGLSIHDGMKSAGIKSRLAFANDIDLDAMEASVSNNPCWDKNTIGLHMSMEQIDTSELPQVDLLIAGLSCKGASRQSRTGKKISMPEFHPEAGSLILPFFNIIASRVNPLICILENVREYLDTASAHMLKDNMGKLGYEVHELELSGQDFGSMENRKRAALVFVTEGICFDAAMLRDFHEAPTRPLSEILDHQSAPPLPPSLDAPMSERNGWYSKARLMERHNEAIAKGAGHRAVIADVSDTRVSTVCASYGRGVRLDETVVESEDGLWLRLFSEVEHALIKDLPPSLVDGVGKTIAHRLLGNSCVAKPWRALGHVLAKCFWSLMQQEESIAA